jgi:hypothetical protein
MITFLLLAAIFFTSYGAWLIHPAAGYVTLGLWCVFVAGVAALSKAGKDKKK